MKKYLLATLLCFFCLIVFSQKNQLLEIPTSSGEIKIQPILHATMAIHFDGKIIYTDPYGGVEAFKNIAKPDLILITDIHGDHMNVETLKSLDLGNTPIIAPKAVADIVAKDFPGVSILANGASTQMLGIKIEAVPMYNLPDDENSRHPKGRGNGYVLTLGTKRIYICGDTEDIPEMRELENIDIAFVCMNQPYTMTIESAASAVLEFQPKIVYPFHYRGKGGFSDVNLFKSLVNNQNSNIDVRLVEWYPE
ncbi:MAG: MBL fold metallo-hydrolase [Reichenbachiella sp.]